MTRTVKKILDVASFWGIFESSAMADDFICNRLDQMIDLRHPHAALARRMRWQEKKASLAPFFAHQVRAGKKIGD